MTEVESFMLEVLSGQPQMFQRALANERSFCVKRASTAVSVTYL